MKKDITIMLTGYPWNPEENNQYTINRDWVSAFPLDTTKREQLLQSRVENYLNFADSIIICKMENAHIDYFRPYHKESSGNSKVRLIETELRTFPHIGSWLFSHQVWNLYQLVNYVETPYIIRIRLDEYYSDLSTVIKVFLEDTKKIVYNNQNWSLHRKDFTDDKFYMCETRILKRAVGILMEHINKGYIPYSNPQSSEYCWGEELISASKHFYPGDDTNILSRCRVVPMELMGKFVRSFKSNLSPTQGITEYVSSLEELYSRSTIIRGEEDLSL